MVNNQVGRPGEESDRQTRGIPESGSDVDEVRNEVPAAGQAEHTPPHPPDQPINRPSQTPDQPETLGAPDTSTRPPGTGPSKEVRFGDNPGAPDDQPILPKAGPAWTANVVFLMGGALFLIIAVIIIIWFLVR